LRQVIEVLVSGVQRKIVLEDQRGQPQVIRGNGRALFSQLAVQQRIVMRCLIIREQHHDAVLHEKATKDPLVFDLSTSVSKTGSKFREHHEREYHDIGALQEVDRLSHALAEVDVPIRVEGNSHRQRRSSI
jgi:hypothetical protein